MVKEWKGRKSDIFVAYGIYLLFVLFVHVATSIKHSLKHDEDLVDNILSIWRFLGVSFLLSLFMSPLWIYLRKVPKSISIDFDTRKLSITRKRRKKSATLDLDQIRYAYHAASLFSVIEIHASFTSSRGHKLEKILSTIMVPNKGMSWNQQVLKEIAGTLDELNVPVSESKPKKFWDYIYD